MEKIELQESDFDCRDQRIPKVSVRLGPEGLKNIRVKQIQMNCFAC